MTEHEPANHANRLEPHIAFAYAGEDADLAVSLWRAMRAQGLSVGLRDETPGRPDATHLLVLCSPATFSDPSVTEIVRTFEQVHGRGRTLALLTDEDQAIAPVLKAQRGPDGFLQAVEDPPSFTLPKDSASANAAAAKAVEQFAFGSAGRKRPAFHQRFAAPIAAGLLSAVVALGAFAVVQGGQLQTERADAQAAQSFSRTMISELTVNLPPQARRDVLIEIGDNILASAFGENLTDLSDDDLARYAQVLHFLGEARDSFGDPSGATAAFEQAHAMTGRSLARAPNDLDRRFEHAQSSFWLANSRYLRGDLEGARPAYETYYDILSGLRRDQPDNMLYRAEYAHATVNMGIVALGTGEAPLAVERFDAAINNFEAGPLGAGTAAASDIANARGWQAIAFQRLGDQEKALNARAAQAAAYANALEDGDVSARNAIGLADARNNQARLLAESGSLAQAAAVLDEALETMEPIWEGARDHARLRRSYAGLLRQRARLALWSDRPHAAQMLLGEARRITVNWDENGADDNRHRDRAALHLQMAEIALRQGAPEAASLEATRAVLAAEQAIAAGFDSFHRTAAAASFLNGEALLRGSQPAEAARAFRRALDHMPEPATRQSSADLDLLARLQFRLGNREAAETNLQVLNDRAYQRPDFVAFWRQSENAAVAQTDISTEEEISSNDG
ncbi:MAG: hypothetical protein AAFX09_09255 [Pseudomonadota bacterium]